MYQVFQLKIIELYYAFFVLIQWMIVKISMTFFSGSHWLSVLYKSFLLVAVQLYKQISKGNIKIMQRIDPTYCSFSIAV